MKRIAYIHPLTQPSQANIGRDGTIKSFIIMPLSCTSTLLKNRPESHEETYLFLLLHIVFVKADRF